LLPAAANQAATAESGSLTRETLLAFLGYGALVAAFTWPVAIAPQRVGVPNPDFYGNTWVLAWVVRQLRRDPLHLFDSNIYWPLPQSLAYNESLIPQALLASPCLLLGGSPLLAHNLAFWLTFALSGAFTFTLARELGASRAGAFLAGAGFALCPVRFKWINNVQCGSLEWLPLSLVFFLRALRRGRWPCLVGLFATALLQALSSGYFALLLPFAFGVALACLLPERPERRRVAAAGAALTLAALCTIAVYSPYLEAQKRDHLYRGEAEWVHWSATLGSYLDPGNYVWLPHQRWLRQTFQGFEPLYPGFVVLVLATVGALALVRPQGPRRLAGHLGMGLALRGSACPWARVSSWDPGTCRARTRSCACSPRPTCSERRPVSGCWPSSAPASWRQPAGQPSASADAHGAGPSRWRSACS
jgi:hypothetical protein